MEFAVTLIPPRSDVDRIVGLHGTLAHVDEDRFQLGRMPSVVVIVTASGKSSCCCRDRRHRATR